MRTISILLFAVLLPSVSDAQGEPDALSTLLDKNEKAVADFKAGKQNDSVTGLMAAASGADLDNDGAFQHCSVLIGYFSGLPMWRDTGIPMSRVENTLDNIIAGDPHWNPPTQADLDAWRSAVASTPQDMADWNTAIKSIYHSKVTEKQIDRALRKYCSNYTKHVFRASDLNDLLSKSQKSQQNNSATSSAPLQRQKVDLSAEHIAYCTWLGVQYARIAEQRDLGGRPMLSTTKQFNEYSQAISLRYYGIHLCPGLERCPPRKEISLKEQKKAINRVYFDPAFKNAGGMPLIKEIKSICIYGPPKPITPIK